MRRGETTFSIISPLLTRPEYCQSQSLTVLALCARLPLRPDPSDDPRFSKPEETRGHSESNNSNNKSLQSYEQLTGNAGLGLGLPPDASDHDLDPPGVPGDFASAIQGILSLPLSLEEKAEVVRRLLAEQPSCVAEPDPATRVQPENGVAPT